MNSPTMSNMVSKLRGTKSVAEVLEILTALADVELSRAERCQVIHRGCEEIQGVADASAVRTVLQGNSPPRIPGNTGGLGGRGRDRNRSELRDDVRRLLEDAARRNGETAGRSAGRTSSMGSKAQISIRDAVCFAGSGTGAAGLRAPYGVC